MQFNKKQKKWLKANGYWKEVKKNRNNGFEKKNTKYYKVKKVILLCSFSWDRTDKGFRYWSNINATMEKEMSNAV